MGHCCHVENPGGTSGPYCWLLGSVPHCGVVCCSTAAAGTLFGVSTLQIDSE